MTRSRGYSFTINNYTAKEIDSVLALEATYIVFGFEQGTQTQQPHIQGYVHFHQQIAFNSVKKMLPTAHLEAARGSPEQNRTYCSKEGEFYEFGELPIQGKCNMERIVAAMKDPHQDFHIYHIYKKSYQSMLNKQKKDHTRTLNIINSQHKLYWSKQHSSVSLDPTIETYEDEEALILPCYMDKDFVTEWEAGFPPKIKRGYEIIKVDPEVIYIMYSDQQERAYLIKKYNSIIDNIYDAPEVHEEDEQDD